MKNEEITNKAIATIEEGTIEILSGTKAISSSFVKRYFQLLATFSEERFKYRLNLFTYDTFRTDEDVKNFWNSIDNKNKSTLLNLISKAMTVTEDIQAFVLAQLFKKLELTGELTYLDKVLFSNIELLVEEDFEILYFYTSKNFELYKNVKSLICKIEDNNSFSEQIIKKLINLSILENKSEQKTEAILANGIGSKVLIDFKFSFTDYSFELMEYLKQYFENHNIDVIEKYTDNESTLDRDW